MVHSVCDLSSTRFATAAAAGAWGVGGEGRSCGIEGGTWRQTGGRAPALARPRESRQSGAHLPGGADSALRTRRDTNHAAAGEPVHSSAALISHTGAQPVPLSELTRLIFHFLFISPSRRATPPALSLPPERTPVSFAALSIHPRGTILRKLFVEISRI